MEEARHCMYAGKSGFGKSYTAGADFEELIIDEAYFGVIIDIKPRNETGTPKPIGDHQGLSKDLNFKRVHIESAEDIHNASVDDLVSLFVEAKRQGFNGIRFTADITVTEIKNAIPELADKVCRAVMRLDFPTVVLIEEVQYAAPHQSKGGKTEQFEGIISILGLGRTSNKILFLTTQEFTKVHTAIYGECNLYKIYFMGKKERKYDKVLDPQRDEEDRQAIQALIEADKLERKFIYYDSNAGVTEVRSSKGLERRTRHDG